MPTVSTNIITLNNLVTSPNKFKVLDSSKENSLFNFELATLTVNTNNQFEEKKVLSFRKFPYFVGIEDNNGSTLPSTLDKSNDPLLKTMFGVHFYDKPLSISDYQTVVGAISVPFFTRPTINTSNGDISWSDENVSFANTPSALSFNVVNGIDEPFVTVNDERVNIYGDDKVVNGTADNENIYKNIKYERRVYTPVPYKRVYDYSDANREYYIFNSNNEFEIINRSDITDSDEIYCIDTKYGEYAKKSTVLSSSNNKIPHYKIGDVDLWKDSIIEHGIETGYDFVDKNDNVVTQGHLVEDDGKYQYITTSTLLTNITANDGYHENTKEIDTNITTDASELILLCGLKDTIEIRINSEQTQSPKTVYFYYYLDVPQATEYTRGNNPASAVYFGKEKPYTSSNTSTFTYMTLDRFVNSPNQMTSEISQYFLDPNGGDVYNTNYPYDMLKVDTFDNGWKYDLSEEKRFPIIFQLSDSDLEKYPGYFYKTTVSSDTDSVKFNLRDYFKLWDAPNIDENKLLGEYEKFTVDTNTNNNVGITDGDVNNLRIFTLTVMDNKKILSPIIDCRCIHVAINPIYMNNAPQGHNYIYVFPQRPTYGDKWGSGAIHDILEIPYLTNYKFTMALSSSSIKQITNSPLDMTGFIAELRNRLRQGENEYYDYTFYNTATIDLVNERLSNEVNPTNAKVRLVYFKFYPNYHIDDNTHEIVTGHFCYVRALQIDTSLFGDDVTIGNGDCFTITDITGTSRWAKMSNSEGIQFCSYDNFVQET